MTTQETIAKGTRVRFTRGPLGMTAGVNVSRFVDEMVNAGDEGVYECPHDQLVDWHWVRVGDNFAPVGREQFEVIEP